MGDGMDEPLITLLDKCGLRGSGGRGGDGGGGGSRCGCGGRRGDGFGGAVGCVGDSGGGAGWRGLGGTEGGRERGRESSAHHLLAVSEAADKMVADPYRLVIVLDATSCSHQQHITKFQQHVKQQYLISSLMQFLSSETEISSRI